MDQGDPEMITLALILPHEYSLFLVLRKTKIKGLLNKSCKRD